MKKRKEEKYRDIKGFEGLYQISEYGDIKSLDREISHYKGGVSKIKGRVLKTPLDKYGYKKAVLFNKGKRTYTTVHRLVALSFITNPNNLPEVNHKDGDKLNNYWKNLEWCTTEDNLKHAHKNNLIDYNKNSGENCYITNLTNKIVKEIREKMANGIKNKDIEKEYSLSRSTVSRIRTNKSFKNI